jgi:diguanylate cyclase (GGDEF)-like protein
MHCLDPGEVYAVALDLLLPALGRELGLALFRRSEMPGSDGIAFRGFDEVAATELQRRVAQAKADSALFAQREPCTTRGGPIGEALEELGVGGGPALLVPLHGAEKEEGLLWVPEQGRPTTPSDLEHAQLIAAHAELALANAERYHQAKERAFIDDVTEVYNARYLLQATEREIHRAARSGKELSVLFLDLDRFKRVNDQYGHLVGSNVLRRLSEVLLDCVRQVDTLARYGGDEFTILLVDTPLRGGVQVAERIRRTVAETLFEGTGGAPIRLTISIGVATFPDHARDREGLLDVADKAMYRAKSKGRNCVCSAEELES